MVKELKDDVFISQELRYYELTNIFFSSPLNDALIEELKQIFFSINNISIDNIALNNMTKYSSGMPTMMQEIGDATFWMDTDNHIDYNDSMNGIIDAGQRIGLKYLQPLIDKKIRSENYLSLFKKIGYEY